MNVYHFRPETGEYLGSSVAETDPLDPSHILVPAFATVTDPPEEQEGHARVFKDDAWSQVVDHRAETWWDSDGRPVSIDFLGDPADRGLIDVEPEPEPGPEPVTIVYPVDLWSRLTDAEADAVETAMTTQSVRIQNIFRAASSYRSDHELWPLLETVVVGLFGAQRAAEILAAS